MQESFEAYKPMSQQLKESELTKEELMAIAREALMESREGITDFFVDGECSKCGGCCGKILPVSRRELKDIRKYIKKKKIKPIKSEYSCPFLNDNRCMVYEVRPRICRIYTCHDHCMGYFNPEMENVVTEVKEVTDMQEWFS